MVSSDVDDIEERWKGYHDKLLNGENLRAVVENGVPNEGWAL